MTRNQRIDVYLICNAKFHDTNFVRLELLKLLAEQEDVMVRVAEDYRNLDAINQAQLLITYTCDLCPTPDQQEGLKRFLTNGKRWFALHVTKVLSSSLWFRRSALSDVRALPRQVRHAAVHAGVLG